MLKNIQILVLLSIFLTFLNSCSGFNKTDAKQFPPDPKERVRKNLEEGRGFTAMGAFKKREVLLATLILQVQMNFGEHHWILLILCLSYLQTIVVVL